MTDYINDQMVLLERQKPKKVGVKVSSKRASSNRAGLGNDETSPEKIK